MMVYLCYYCLHWCLSSFEFHTTTQRMNFLHPRELFFLGLRRKIRVLDWNGSRVRGQLWEALCRLWRRIWVGIAEVLAFGSICCGQAPEQTKIERSTNMKSFWNECTCLVFLGLLWPTKRSTSGMDWGKNIDRMLKHSMPLLRCHTSNNRLLIRGIY